MSTLATSNLTLADWAKRTDPDGRIPIIAELLSQSNEVLEDCVFKEGNLPTGERVVIRTGLPGVYWRALNQGIPSTKSTTAQVDEAAGILEARSEVDKDLAMLNGNTAQFRLSEDSAFLEAMNQTQATTLFYGNPGTDPKQYLGMAPRYSSLSAANAQNILSAGGSGSDNTSVFLVVWGDNTVYCHFPKGSKAGLIHEDLGEQTVYNSDGTRLQAYATRYQWKNGLVVKDWRYVVRICNIDVSDLIGQTGTQAASAATNIVKLMARSLYRIPNMAMGRAAFYMNRTVHSGLSIAALDKSQYVLKINEGLSQFGTPYSWLSFLGVPLRRVDAIINAEAVVS
ncbi:major capsid protein [uncultured Caudovirales phage]|uniref:Major capsid protein n=1 Tax=uncultured Caudovirales phage TaxID=2100421 RepID=A0A6J5KZR2_9CAUD|nr:major capsid protein [uncultured Caudovirales phage]